jgi:hypothetical protein
MHGASMPATVFVLPLDVLPLIRCVADGCASKISKTLWESMDYVVPKTPVPHSSRISTRAHGWGRGGVSLIGYGSSQSTYRAR